MYIKNKHLILINVIVIIFGLLLFWYAGRPKRDNVVVVQPNAQTAAPAGTLVQRDVTLYFASDDGENLVAETRQIACSDELSCVEAVVAALISGSTQGAGPVLPAQTKITGVEVDNGTAVLDFSPEIASGHPGGSQPELLTVYALADSLAVNFPHIRQAALRINGTEVETLKGHVDLRRPLLADFSLVRRTAPRLLGESPEENSKKEE